ncbi:PAS domain-containing protein [Solimonas variicoloris]|uniref:PAS domain S-box protein n=1 Tax=Solimonas variicoloris TaxID=254408 RepID=UPI000A01CD6E
MSPRLRRRAAAGGGVDSRPGAVQVARSGQRRAGNRQACRLDADHGRGGPIHLYCDDTKCCRAGIPERQPRTGISMSNDEQASVAERSRDIAAAHSAGWLGAVLDVMPSAVMLVNADGRIELANHRAARLFGYETAELRDLPIDALVPDDKRAAHAAERTRFMQKPGHPRDGGRARTVRRAQGRQPSADRSRTRRAAFRQRRHGAGLDLRCQRAPCRAPARR